LSRVFCPKCFLTGAAASGVAGVSMYCAGRLMFMPVEEWAVWIAFVALILNWSGLLYGVLRMVKAFHSMEPVGGADHNGNQD
jgi:hypothetical protein